MRDAKDVQKFLQAANLDFSDLGDGLFILRQDNGPLNGLAVKVTPQLVIIQRRIAPVPPVESSQRLPLYEKLLELNASGLLHTAFGIQAGEIFLLSALPLLNLDPNELQAVLDDVSLALSLHIPQLYKLINPAGG